MKGFSLAFALLLLAAAPASAAVQKFNFSHGGFSEGASVTGFFTADDLDSNGQISSFGGEVLDFGATFSGNSLVSAFTLDFADLFGLVYDLGSGAIGDSTALDIEGIGAFDGINNYVVGPGPVALCDGAQPCAFVGVPDNDIDFSAEPAVVSVVPEPGVWAAMIAGFGLVGSALRRRPRLSLA